MLTPVFVCLGQKTNVEKYLLYLQSNMCDPIDIEDMERVFISEVLVVFGLSQLLFGLYHVRLCERV